MARKTSRQLKALMLGQINKCTPDAGTELQHRTWIFRVVHKHAVTVTYYADFDAVSVKCTFGAFPPIDVTLAMVQLQVACIADISHARRLVQARLLLHRNHTVLRGANNRTPDLYGFPPR